MLPANRKSLGSVTALGILATMIHGCEKAQVKYVDPQHTFTFSYPSSWKVESNAPLILLTGDGSGTAMPSKVFAVRQAAPWGLGWALSSANFDDIQGGIVRGLAQRVERAKVESSSDTTLGGKAARSAIIVGHSARSGSDFKVIALFCVHDGAVYTFTGTAAPDRFDPVRDDVAAVTSSFQILQK
jgi:hypothetical protein